MTILSKGTHVLVFPFPAQGHMIPLLDLTHHLATLDLSITILVTPKNLPLLHPLLSTNPSIRPLTLPFPSHPLLPPGIENATDLSFKYLRVLIQALGELKEPLFSWFKSHSTPPVAIISDMFLGWTHHLACQLGIPRVVFSPSGAEALSTMYSLWKEMPGRNDPLDENEVMFFPSLPNSPKYPWWQLSGLYRGYVDGDTVSEFLKSGFLSNIASWGLVINTFDGIESVYLDHLRKELGHGRVWAMGPVLPPDDSHTENGKVRGPKERGGSASISADDMLKWLDTCEDGEAVYVCFGSQTVLPNAQMEALALALESSGVRFVWSVKEPAKEHVEGDYGKIPSGFENRVVGRGLVVRGWAPQVVILGHPAVGAFLTHCGWNSVLEAVVAGVPMLAWPMGADQFTNAGLLVDVLKVGVRVCEGAKTVPDPDKLAQVIAESVSGNRVEKERAKEISKAAICSIKDGGSSVKDLEVLVQHLSSLKFSTK